MHVTSATAMGSLRLFPRNRISGSKGMGVLMVLRGRRTKHSREAESQEHHGTKTVLADTQGVCGGRTCQSSVAVKMSAADCDRAHLTAQSPPSVHLLGLYTPTSWKLTPSS